jgi:predicted ArsR family transcriptional regulator
VDGRRRPVFGPQVGTLGPGRRRDPAIAAELGLSQKTIRNHVSNILTKLQVADRAQAIVQARDAGLGRKSRI